MQPIEPKYSVIIPTYNRAKTLVLTLDSVCSQTLSPEKYEILVVDDGSIDDTKEVVLGFQKKYTNFSILYFYEQNAGPAKARNLGIKEAKGEIIFFTDDDCTVPSNWMETLSGALSRYPAAAGAGGWILPPAGEVEKNAVSRYLYSIYFPASESGRRLLSHEIFSNDPLRCFFGVSVYNTASICYKKEVLLKVGGFRDEFRWPGAEDNDLALRIALAGHSLLYIPFHVTHSKDMSFFNFVKMCFNYGANNYLLRKLNYTALEELKPGFANSYGSLASFIPHFSNASKFLALIHWAATNLGIMYMKRKLEKQKSVR